MNIYKYKIAKQLIFYSYVFFGLYFTSRKLWYLNKNCLTIKKECTKCENF